MRIRLIAAGFLLAMLATPAVAQQPDVIEQHGDWTLACAGQDPKQCVVRQVLLSRETGTPFFM